MAGKKKIGALTEAVRALRRSNLPAETRAQRSFPINKRPVIDPVDQHWRKNKETKELELIDGPPFPRIWESPRTLASEAAEAVAPEDPALRQLFGVTRDDLYELSKRAGNRPGQIVEPANARGSDVGNAVVTPRNTQRVQDVLAESQRHPGLYKGMHAWYTMDPAYERLVQLVGPDEAARRYDRWNTLTSMSSPGSEVLTELERGAAANHLQHRGAFDLFERYGGLPAERKAKVIEEAKRTGDNYLLAHADGLEGVSGHPYHRTSQALPMRGYVDTGTVDMGSPKVPLYMQASRPPQLGFQTNSPVPDAHFTRFVGISDVRRSQNPGASMKTPEYLPVRRWFRDDVTAPMGIEAVPGQAVVWGAGSRATGVTSPIGAPKLELTAQYIMRRARETGLPPDLVRDRILLGEMRAKGGHVRKRGALNHIKRRRAA